jgi:hypothetical protein
MFFSGISIKIGFIANLCGMNRTESSVKKRPPYFILRPVALPATLS